MCERVQLLSDVAILCDFSGYHINRLVHLNSAVHHKGVGSVFDKMISTHLIGTESDLQCCVNSNGGGRLAELFPPALQSFLGNESYY